jgi:hypothetical protein
MANHLAISDPFVQLLERLRKTRGTHLCSLAAALLLLKARHITISSMAQLTSLQKEKGSVTEITDSVHRKAADN